MIQFASCLGSLPFLEELYVRDNRLTDNGLYALLHAIFLASQARRLHLRVLDVSENEIGTASANMLRQLLESRDCTLTRLVMAKADVDDF
jgi:hypothetical protein